MSWAYFIQEQNLATYTYPEELEILGYLDQKWRCLLARNTTYI